MALLPFISFPSASFLSLLLPCHASIPLLLSLSCSPFFCCLFTSVPILPLRLSVRLISISIFPSYFFLLYFLVSSCPLPFLPAFSFSPCFFSLFLPLTLPALLSPLPSSHPLLLFLLRLPPPFHLPPFPSLSLFVPSLLISFSHSPYLLIFLHISSMFPFPPLNRDA